MISAEKPIVQATRLLGQHYQPPIASRAVLSRESFNGDL
jgi:hypothetical protein